MLSFARIVLPDAVRLEWIGLTLSLALAVFGLTAASLGAMRVVRRSTPSRRYVVPFGSLLVVAVAPFWDFATSGLEMGVVFAWLGASFWVSTVLATMPALRRRDVWCSAVLFGIGPLIRPDLAVFSAAFLVAEVMIDREVSWRARAGVLAVGLALPVLYEIFRMGYYAALVPNSALAKNAAGAAWSRGFDYLKVFVSSSALEAPLLLVAAALVATAVRLRRRHERALAIVCAAPVLGGLVHALFVVRVGGDFFLGRLLLPAAFAIAMPVAVVALSDAIVVGGVAAMTIWAVVCASVLRPGHGDQRAFYISLTHHEHPITIDDYRSSVWVRSTLPVERALRRGDRLLVVPVVGSFLRDSHGRFIPDVARTLPLAPSTRAKAGFAYTAIGAVSYALGPDVFVVDRLGLGEPIGSRLSGFPSYLPVGHERYMAIPWVEARAADPRAHDPDHDRQVFREAAAQVLTCDQPARLMRDVRAPLTFHRFLSNITDAPQLTRLRIPQNPFTAAASLCPARR